MWERGVVRHRHRTRQRSRIPSHHVFLVLVTTNQDCFWQFYVRLPVTVAWFSASSTTGSTSQCAFETPATETRTIFFLLKVHHLEGEHLTYHLCCMGSCGMVVTMWESKWRNFVWPLDGNNAFGQGGGVPYSFMGTYYSFHVASLTRIYMHLLEFVSVMLLHWEYCLAGSIYCNWSLASVICLISWKTRQRGWSGMYFDQVFEVIM